MPKYLCIARSESGQCQPPSPTQMEEMYSKFHAWMERFQENIVDMGGKLQGAGKVVTSEGISDGPFVESKEIIGGFMIIQAESLEEATEITRLIPGAATPGTSMEVREISSP